MYPFHSCHNVSGECRFCECLRALSIFNTCYVPVTQCQGRDGKLPQSWPASCPPSKGLTSRGEWVFPGTASSSFTKERVSRHTSSPPESWGAEQARTHGFRCLPCHTLSRVSKGTVKSHKLSKYRNFTQNELSIVLGSKNPWSVKGWATYRVLILWGKGGRQYQSSGNICV